MKGAVGDVGTAGTRLHILCLIAAAQLLHIASWTAYWSLISIGVGNDCHNGANEVDVGCVVAVQIAAPHA